MSTSALKTPADIEKVAALLSEIADEYNARLKEEAGKLSSGEIFARLQEEQRLRSLANQLHFEANEKILADVVDDQDKLEASLKQAKAKLKKFQDFAKALDLIADVLVLAGAILAKKPKTIIAALKEVRDDLSDAKATAEA